MIIRRYRNGVLISEEVQQPPSQPTPTQLPAQRNTPQPSQVPTSPKKGCGCGKKK
jgi:hypothetical protein